MSIIFYVKIMLKSTIIGEGLVVLPIENEIILLYNEYR
jgi:hypothetical protein